MSKFRYLKRKMFLLFITTAECRCDRICQRDIAISQCRCNRLRHCNVLCSFMYFTNCVLSV